MMENRYDRNIRLKQIGAEGQAKLKAAKVLVIGAGGLGSSVLSYLTAAGVGTLGIVDDDVVNITNLQRQILHFTADVGTLKTISAQSKLTALNPDVKIECYAERFTEENAERTSVAYDFIIDCSDNYATKLRINDVCVRMQKPFSHGAVVAMRGEVMTYIPGSACYRCVFDVPPEDGALPTALQKGILGSVAGIVGSIQATEAIKYLTSIGGLLTDRLLIIDAETMTFNSLKVKQNHHCACALK
jgi:molybdopterin/thiamine biosynthesis adenylyltransferase